MKRGDVVVVPIWDTFSVCRISDDRVLTNETIDMDLMTDGHGNSRRNIRRYHDYS